MPILRITDTDTTGQSVEIFVADDGRAHRTWVMAANVAVTTGARFRLQGDVGYAGQWANLGAAATTQSSTAGEVVIRSTAPTGVTRVRLDAPAAAASVGGSVIAHVYIEAE